MPRPPTFSIRPAPVRAADLGNPSKVKLTIGRERRTIRARYQLVDLVSGAIMLDATAGADAGIDVVSSEFATIQAENKALENLSNEVAERIITQLALTLRKGAAGEK